MPRLKSQITRQCLPDKAWDAAEHLDSLQVEQPGGFALILAALGAHYQHDDGIEAPEKFSRRSDEILSEL